MTSSQSTTSIEVPSASEPGVVYLVTRRGDYVSCTCPGFVYRGRCKHATAFAPARRDVAAGASLYEEIWGRDGELRPAAPTIPLIGRMSA